MKTDSRPGRALLVAAVMALAFAFVLRTLIGDDASPGATSGTTTTRRGGLVLEPPADAADVPARALPSTEAPRASDAAGDVAAPGSADAPVGRVIVPGRLVLENADGAPGPREVIAAWAGREARFTAPVAPDGTFRLELEPSNVPAGRFVDRLLVKAAPTPGWWRPLASVEPGLYPLVVLAVRADASLRGTVVDPAGHPVGGAYVRLGRYGPARIVFRSERDQAAGVATTVLTAGGIAEVQLDSRRATRARVRVVDHRGQRLRGAAIRAEGPNVTTGATTDHDGEATFGELVPGTWTFGVRDDALPRLAARLGVERLVVAPVEVQVQGEPEVEVVLRARQP